MLHSWFSGTDTNFALTRWMYWGTALVVVLMTFLWLMTRKSNPPIKGMPAPVRAPSVPPAPDALSLPSLSPKTARREYMQVYGSPAPPAGGEYRERD